MLRLTENRSKRIEVYTPYLTVPSAQYSIHLPGIGAPQQMQYFHQIQYLEIKCLLYGLPIRKVLRYPVGIAHFFFSVLVGYCKSEMWL